MVGGWEDRTEESEVSLERTQETPSFQEKRPLSQESSVVAEWGGLEGAVDRGSGDRAWRTGRGRGKQRPVHGTDGLSLGDRGEKTHQ